MSPARTQRRLPGFRFEVQAPPLAEALPRMDVAIFVGFAASGPIEMPVAVESSAQFEAIFGADAPIAWDRQRGTQAYAYLAPAVRAFFRNGGVRCWIVRVARRSGEIQEGAEHDCARANYFPVAGLARADFDAQGRLIGIAPAFARARAEGSWSDSLRVATALQTRPLQISQIVSLEGLEPIFDLAVSSPADIIEGDLLRFTFQREGYVLLSAVKKMDSAPESSPPFSPRIFGRRIVRITGTKAVWCRRFSVDEFSLPSGLINVSTYTFEPESLTNDNLALEQERPPTFETITQAVLVSPIPSSPPAPSVVSEQPIEQTLTFDLTNISFADAPQPGALLRLDFPGQPVLLTVQRVAMHRDEAQSREVARVTGQAVATLPGNPLPTPVDDPTVEKLSFELWVRQGDEYAISLPDLAFEPSHPRFWGLLPTDQRLYQEALTGERTTPAIVWWRPAGDVYRFPLAGPPTANENYFPLAMSALPDQYQRPVRLPGSTLERDGLATFDASLFLDEALIESNVENFLSQSEFLRYLIANPRALHGLHSAVGVDEATIIAVPDAVHRGWELAPEEAAPSVQPPQSLPHPEWWHFLDCHSKPEIKLVPEPEWGNFLSCGIKIVARPVLQDASEPQNQSGTFSLSWTLETDVGTPNESIKFILEESTNADFIGAVTIYEGPAFSYTNYGRRPGDYYYRVRVIVGSNTSDWSNATAVRVTSVSRWQVRPEADYVPDTLLAVQRALLRMCAARGDLFALLSLPEHYRETLALDHVNTLKLTPERTPPTEGLAPLGYAEQGAFSYGAIYHPWLVGREENRFTEVRRTPPCGALGGVLAQRAIKRGPWIAPANEVLKDVVTLFPPLLPERRLNLQQAQINLIRQEPRGFLSLSADTLSDDEDFRPINVRRLLMLIRRMALRLGATYVFEPQSDAFRRLVARGFNAMLDQMFVRGAFGGRLPSDSYQVVTDNSLNTPQSIEQGRFIVELKIRPSLPMTFLTIRLVQSGDRGLVTEGRS